MRASGVLDLAVERHENCKLYAGAKLRSSFFGVATTLRWVVLSPTSVGAFSGGTLAPRARKAEPHRPPLADLALKLKPMAFIASAMGRLMSVWKNVIVVVAGAAAGYVLSGFTTLTSDSGPEPSEKAIRWRAESSGRSREADRSAAAEPGLLIPRDLAHALLEGEESGSLVERLRSEHGDFSYLVLRQLFDRDPTLGFLSSIRDPATSQAIATQLLGIVGDDEEAVR